MLPSPGPAPGPGRSPGPAPAPPFTPSYQPYQPAPYAGPTRRLTAPPRPPRASAPDAGVYAPPPTAALNGTIQPPPPTWDPYAVPGVGEPGFLPSGNYLQLGPGVSFAQMQRFLQEVRVDYHFFAAMGSQPLGIDDTRVDEHLRLALSLQSADAASLITPGFATHFWNGPNSSGPPPADMPADTFDAYLDAAWNPHVNHRFSGELAPAAASIPTSAASTRDASG